MTESSAALAPSVPEPLCRLDELQAGSARTFELLRRKKSGRAIKWSIFVVRTSDALIGYVNKCPHQPVPLDWEGNSIVDPTAQHLQCGRHGARFELANGRCYHGPCTGEALQSVELRVQDGAVYVQNVELVSPPKQPTPAGIAP